MSSDIDSSNGSMEQEYIARARPLADVLNALHDWHEPIIKPTEYTASNSMSKWSSKFNDAVIRSNFKIFRRLVSADELAAQHFFMGEMELVSISELQTLFDYAVDATNFIDTCEKDLFCPSNVKNSAAKVQKFANIMVQYSCGQFMRDLKGTFLGLVGKSEIEQVILSRIQGGIHKWVMDLHRLIIKDPKNCPERKYEELARNFFEIFGLHCTSGDAEHFAIPYCDDLVEKEILSRPGLLLRQMKPGAPYCAVVEVKSMVVDPEFKHLSPKPKKASLKTSAEVSSEESSAPKKRKDDESLNADEHKRRRVSFTLSDESAEEETQETKWARSFDESSLPPKIRSLVDTFFCQLFGDVMALDCCQSLLPKKVMGIGVVGFKVIFMSFQQHDDISFYKVCDMPGTRIDVYMTSPLSMLNAADRQKIVKILLQLATENVTYV